MDHTHRPPSLLPAAGQERTYALIIAGVPLLLILLAGFVPRLASDGAGSGGTAVDGQGGYSYQPSAQPSYQPSSEASATDPVTPDATTAPTSGTDLSPSPADTGSATGPAGADDPATTVDDYFTAINDRDFRTAWNLGGKNLDSSHSAFVSGFGTTERDDVTVGSVDGTTVSVSLVATQTDGTQKSYSGRYTVVDGVITDASVTPTG
ncbi:hypothetical protein [Streptomyces sp. MMG1121]|uniref:hypothetical protein n=1 Tax=Streptomyces sp. MMG1121 TaxID=1415544 RepID=UPI0006AE73C5|nr:hypothetical protein [Streptomyces sp. MMG1121]KOV63714.1 hypothetical protein ADK64_19400 [Streptomyces sp. MMG1121]